MTHRRFAIKFLGTDETRIVLDRSEGKAIVSRRKGCVSHLPSMVEVMTWLGHHISTFVTGSLVVIYGVTYDGISRLNFYVYKTIFSGKQQKKKSYTTKDFIRQ